MNFSAYKVNFVQQKFAFSRNRNRTGTENFGTEPNRNRKFWDRTEPEPKILEPIRPYYAFTLSRCRVMSQDPSSGSQLSFPPEGDLIQVLPAVSFGKRKRYQLSYGGWAKNRGKGSFIGKLKLLLYLIIWVFWYILYENRC